MAVVNFDDSLRMGGGTMTTPRQERFLHLGGPYDGAQMSVDVDDDGVPAEFNAIPDMTTPDLALNSLTIQSKQLTALYDRDTRIGDDGLEYVFRFRNQAVSDPNEALPEAA
jgi:hypothetical protein